MYRNLLLRALRNTKKLQVRLNHCASAPTCTQGNESFSKGKTQVQKITILGANNRLGKHLAFLLKRFEIIKEIHLHDNCNVRGLALDLMHMNTKVKVKPNSGDYALKYALRHSDIVVITDGYDTILDKDGRGQLKQNAEIVYRYAMKIASTCPEALICIVTPPINIMVPIFSEAMRSVKAYNPNRIFGVPALMEMRANSVVANYLSIDPAAVRVPIVGGATSTTGVPLLSHAKPYNEFTVEEIKKLMCVIRQVADECKKKNTAAPLSTAYALARFVLTLANGMCQEKCAIQSAYVRSCVLPQVEYFTSGIHTTERGAVANYGLPKIHEEELNILGQVLVELEADIALSATLYEQLSDRKKIDEVEEICKSTKPFISKTPCPPMLPCYPLDVCFRKSARSCCAPAERQNPLVQRENNLASAVCCKTSPK